MKRPKDIEIVEDRTADSRPDEGFLRVRRYLVRNQYADGTASAAYACDVVSRAHPDAVAVVPFAIDEDGVVRVALRSGVRPAVYLRKHKHLVQPDEREHLLLVETVAGLLEDDDTGDDGLARRAAAECAEEAGYRIDPTLTIGLGHTLFPSPGVSDEKVFFRAIELDLEDRGDPSGDGSVMEEAGEVVVLPLREAIHRCRSGEMPDMKTEIALLRLCDLIGYVPLLASFLDDLPDELTPDDAVRRYLLGQDR